MSNDVFACTDINFSGNCTLIRFNDAQCQNFPPAFDNEISSISPDSGWACNFFEYVQYFKRTISAKCSWYLSDYDCAGLAFPIAFPGYASLVDVDLNDLLSSFVCSSD